MARVVGSPFWRTVPALAACAAWLLVFLLWPLQAWPLGAAAPFTPPAALSVKQTAAAPLSAEGADAAASAPDAASPAAAVLTGIKLGAQPQALIDGRWWPRGSLVNGARLTAISAQSVQLRHADGRIEALMLTPQVDWQRVSRQRVPMQLVQQAEPLDEKRRP